MKYEPPEFDGDTPVVELSRRNLEALLEKLDDPLSLRTILGWANDGTPRFVIVRAVENEQHYSDREPGPMVRPSTGEMY